jgi:hypothetical protein
MVLDCLRPCEKIKIRQTGLALKVTPCASGDHEVDILGNNDNRSAASYRHEFQRVSALSLSLADRAWRKFNDGVCGQTARETPGRHCVANFLDAVIAIQINQVDWKSHGEGVNSFTRDDPKTFSGSERLSAQQTLIALWSAVGDFHAGGKEGLARHIQDAHAHIRSWLVAWKMTIPHPREKLTDWIHPVTSGFLAIQSRGRDWAAIINCDGSSSNTA